MAILLDQLKTALIEPADESLQGLNVSSGGLSVDICDFKVIRENGNRAKNLSKPYASTEGVTRMTSCRLLPNPQVQARSDSVACT